MLSSTLRFGATMQMTAKIHTRKSRTGLKALRILLGAYALLLLAMVLFEAHLVYPGAYLNRSQGPHPAADSPVQTVRYQASDETPLEGRLLVRKDAKTTILYLHGNGTLAIWLDAHLVRIADRFDAHILAAEFRGFDANDVTPTEASVIADAQAARRFLCQRFDLKPDQIVLYGRSLGGGVAAALAADGGAKAVILDRTFDSLVNVAAGHYPWLPVRYLMRNRYDSVLRLTDYRGPVVQLHGTADRIVPIKHAKALHRNLNTSDKAWIQVAGLGHNDWLPDRALQQIVDAVQEPR